jgi:hypothetical protein
MRDKDIKIKGSHKKNKNQKDQQIFTATNNDSWRQVSDDGESVSLRFKASLIYQIKKWKRL